jgi:hypothetical protein
MRAQLKSVVVRRNITAGGHAAWLEEAKGGRMLGDTV